MLDNSRKNKILFQIAKHLFFPMLIVYTTFNLPWRMLSNYASQNILHIINSLQLWNYQNSFHSLYHYTSYATNKNMRTLPWYAKCKHRQKTISITTKTRSSKPNIRFHTYQIIGFIVFSYNFFIDANLLQIHFIIEINDVHKCSKLACWNG